MIEILNYYEEIKETDGKKLTFIDIKLKNGLIVRRLMEFNTDKGRWFNWPTFFKKNVDGSKKYIPYIEFELTVHNGEFQEKLKEAVKEFKIKNKIAEPPPLDLNDDLPF